MDSHGVEVLQNDDGRAGCPSFVFPISGYVPDGLPGGKRIPAEAIRITLGNASCFWAFQREKEAEMTKKKGETEGIRFFSGNGQNYLGDNLGYIGSCRD